MWHFNLLNGGSGRSGLPASAQPGAETQPTRSKASGGQASPGRSPAKTLTGEHGSETHAAAHPLRSVHFYCRAPQARSVQLTGDFSHWHPIPMERRDGGWWFIQVMLVHGHHQYRFLVDGKPELDPRATGKARDSSNEEVSVVAVG